MEVLYTYTGDEIFHDEEVYVFSAQWALVKRGVPADKCICQGRGSSRPVADNSTPEGKAANRRVEITLFSK